MLLPQKSLRLSFTASAYTPTTDRVQVFGLPRQLCRTGSHNRSANERVSRRVYLIESLAGDVHRVSTESVLDF